MTLKAIAPAGYVTAGEAAKTKGVSVATIRKWADKQKVRSARVNKAGKVSRRGRHLMILEHDLRSKTREPVYTKDTKSKTVVPAVTPGVFRSMDISLHQLTILLPKDIHQTLVAGAAFGGQSVQDVLVRLATQKATELRSLLSNLQKN